MKTPLHLRLVYCCILCLCHGCISKNDFSDDNPDDNPATEASIAYLKSLYRNYPLRVSESIELQAVVTANDSYGGFRNTLVVEDQTGGVEIKVGGEELFLDFPVGQGVRIYAQGLVLGSYGGVVSLGTASEDPAYQNGFISQSVVPQYIRPHGKVTDVRPDTLTFKTLTASAVSRYVAFEQVQFADEEVSLPWCDPELDTDRHLVNLNGDTLIVRTSRFADFANRPLPSGSGYIEGVLSWFNRSYQLRIVTPKGVFMESPRFPSSPDR